MTREESGRKGLSGMIILAGDQSVSGVEGGVEVVVDLQVRILYASPSMEDVLGYTEEEFLHLSHRDLYHPDEAPLLDNKLEWVESAVGDISQCTLADKRR